MKKFYWNTIGNGHINLILLHGWGIDSKIWSLNIKELDISFKLYIIDLPGFGKNIHLKPMCLNDVIHLLHFYMPKNSIWLGWSISGLIVSKLSLIYPKDILGIITVSSSPCFLTKKNWPGIKKNILKNICENLKTDYYNTIINFLSYQNINTFHNIDEFNILKKILISQPIPNIDTLEHGLEMLCITDLREHIALLDNIPFLRIYGSLDKLVPKKIAKILDNKWPLTQSVIIKKAGHIPFISHKKIFLSIISNFIKKISFNITS